jgi:hypothetical protein
MTCKAALQHKNIAILTWQFTATTMPQTHLQWKRGNTASKPEDDMITVQKNEYQNAKQIFVIRHVARDKTVSLGDNTSARYDAAEFEIFPQSFRSDTQCSEGWYGPRGSDRSKSVNEDYKKCTAKIAR